MVVGRLLSYWEGNFSGAMLVFGKVFVWFDDCIFFLVVFVESKYLGKNVS